MSRFLEVDDILEIHAMLLVEFGGAEGLRDAGLLRSAVAQPQAGFGGTLAHPTIIEQAAAYLFHLVSNHPFIDGNKRTGLVAALVFLRENGLTILQNSDALYEMTVAVASGRLDKAGVALELARIASAP